MLPFFTIVIVVQKAAIFSKMLVYGEFAKLILYMMLWFLQ